MKTPEEWTRYKDGVRFKSDGKRYWWINLDDIKAIQLDSFKAGMGEAAEICNTHRLSQFDPTRDGLDGFRKAILAARNAKTSL